MYQYWFVNCYSCNILKVRFLIVGREIVCLKAGNSVLSSLFF